VSRVALWLRIAALWIFSAALLVAADPPAPRHSRPLAAAVAFGIAGGIGLYVLLARRRPPPPSVRLPLALVLAIWAGAEEVLWRWFALAEAAQRVGSIAALAATSLGFAAVHRPRTIAHAVAGGVFGLAYLFAGGLAAAWAAHVAYNLLVASRRAPGLSFSDTGATPAAG
jgi:membrane protease YdiL (CAAX protease family)